MKLVFLDTNTMGEGLDYRLFSAFGTLETYESTPHAEIGARLSDADVALTNKCKLTAETLKDAKNLKLICVAATGFDNIDVAYCRAHGIAVSNVRGYSTDSVVELTVAMVLELMLHFSVQHPYVYDGSYTRAGVANHLTPTFHELRGLTWGIVGAGNIGHGVARVAEAFGCRVVVNRRSVDPEYETLPLPELLKISDIVTLHTPLNDTTRGLIGERELALMKDGAILVNVARGAVTDENAVVSAVLSGKLGGFGTDVYSVEPFPADHPMAKLCGLPNVCLTPHMAWGAFEARKRCLSEMGKNIEAFLKGEARNRVD